MDRRCNIKQMRLIEKETRVTEKDEERPDKEGNIGEGY